MEQTKESTEEECLEKFHFRSVRSLVGINILMENSKSSLPLLLSAFHGASR